MIFSLQKLFNLKDNIWILVLSFVFCYCDIIFLKCPGETELYFDINYFINAPASTIYRDIKFCFNAPAIQFKKHFKSFKKGIDFSVFCGIIESETRK